MHTPASRQLAVTLQHAWTALNDPHVIQACLPGIHNIQSLGDIVQLQRGSIVFDAPNDTGGGKGLVEVQLVPADEGCRIDCTLYLPAVTTTATDAPQPPIDAIASAVAEDFLARFDAEIQRRSLVAAPHVQPSSIPNPMTPEPKANDRADDGFAPTLIAEEAPPGHAGSPLYRDDKKFPRWVWPLAILVLFLLWWFSR